MNSKLGNSCLALPIETFSDLWYRVENWMIQMGCRELCNIGYQSEAHLSPRTSPGHNLSINHPIVLKFCSEHGNDTAVLLAKFKNNWTIETDVMDDRHFKIFELMMNFKCTSYIAEPPRLIRERVYLAEYPEQMHMDKSCLVLLLLYS